MNLARDPRWGRTSETPGEDPYLTSRYVEHFVGGLQGCRESRYLMVVATCKHAVANNLNNWCDDLQPRPRTGARRLHGPIGGHCFTRNDITEQIDAFDLASSFLPAWQGCVESGARSIMMSENTVKGLPNGASRPFMSWFRSRGFQGYFTTDCGGIEDVKREANESFLQAAVEAVHAGIDLECPGDVSYLSRYIPKAVRSGIMNVSVVDQAVERTLAIVIDLGLVDPPERVPWKRLGLESVDSQEHRKLALEAAQQSLVLLRNDAAVLPLSRGSRVALLGPYANATGQLLGQSSYRGVNRVVESRSVFDGLRLQQLNLTYVEGCKINQSMAFGLDAAVAAAEVADVAVLVLGIDEHFEDEGLDRFSLDLPRPQLDLLDAAANVDTPIVLITMHGGALSLESHLNKTSAMVDAFYPGEFGGIAIAQMLSGDFSPSGVLPVTYYVANYTRRNMTDFNLRSLDGTTYQHYKPSPVFSFGHGLSYTEFEVSSAASVQANTTTASVEVKVKVANIGKVLSAVALLAFVRHDSAEFPLRRLGAFVKIELTPGATEDVLLAIHRQAFASTDESGSQKVYAGTYMVDVRGSTTAVELFGPVSHISDSLEVHSRSLPDAAGLVFT